MRTDGDVRENYISNLIKATSASQSKTIPSLRNSSHRAATVLRAASTVQGENADEDHPRRTSRRGWVTFIFSLLLFAYSDAPNLNRHFIRHRGLV